MSALAAVRSGPPTDERDAFEAWALSDHRSIEPAEYEGRTPENNHYYADDSDNAAYVGWCARALKDKQP